MRHTSAFSLIELIIAVAIMGIIAGIAIPAVNKSRDKAETENMRSRAVSLQTAKRNIINILGYDQASSVWGAATDANRYLYYLRQYLPTNAPATLGEYIPSPFSINLGAAITDPVALTGPAGAIPLAQ